MVPVSTHTPIVVQPESAPTTKETPNNIQVPPLPGCHSNPPFDTWDRMGPVLTRSMMVIKPRPLIIEPQPDVVEPEINPRPNVNSLGKLLISTTVTVTLFPPNHFVIYCIIKYSFHIAGQSLHLSYTPMRLTPPTGASLLHVGRFLCKSIILLTIDVLVLVYQIYQIFIFIFIFI